MQPEPHKTEKEFGKALKSFTQLPAKIKELELLKDQAEKSTGQESLDLHTLIRDKFRQRHKRVAPKGVEA